MLPSESLDLRIPGEAEMIIRQPIAHVPLSKNWSSHVPSAVLQVISLAQNAMVEVRGCAANSVNPRLRLAADIERLETEAALELPGRVATSKRPRHVWRVDLTVVPTSAGFWTSWLPFSLPRRWPFCWWVAVVLDHYSRRAMGITVSPARPSPVHVRSPLGCTIRTVGQKPKHLISDQGKQYHCAAFKTWCRRRGIRPRFSAVGKHGSIAIIERFIQTLKSECTRRSLVPHRRKTMRRELLLFLSWYNAHRPHTTLAVRTPDEAYLRSRPAHRVPRYGPRPRWPGSSPCAAPATIVRAAPGVQLDMKLVFHGGGKHLPVVTLRRAA